MNTQLDFDRLLDTWLADGPSELSDRAVSRIVQSIDDSKRGPTWLPRRETMNRFLVAAGSVAAIALIAVVGIGLVSGGGLFGPGATTSPTSSPEPTVAPSPQPTVAPSPEPTATPAPTRTPDAGLPVGPFDLEDNGMAMTVIIPAPGWTLVPQYTLLMKGVEVANLPEAGILFWSWPAGTQFYVPGDSCQVTSTRPETPATTVDEIAAALAAQAPSDASEPEDVTVGGYEGKFITLHVPDDAVFGECETREFIRYEDTQDGHVGRNAQGPGQIDELWILDVDGAIVIIDATYRPDTPAELIEETRGIVESTTFDTL